MIDGYRTVFDLGGLVSPLAQTEGAHVRRGNEGQLPPGQVASASNAGETKTRSGAPRPLVQPQKPDATKAEEDVSRSLKEDGGGAETPGPAVEPPRSRSQPSLPQLSAEALATALMTAEPDKAMVPRVLPADPVDAS
ncbi:MAG: hypothetical protein AAGF50_04095 [Pseudomonadota bacterium]